jgi:hypothetical protein
MGKVVVGGETFADEKGFAVKVEKLEPPPPVIRPGAHGA